MMECNDLELSSEESNMGVFCWVLVWKSSVNSPADSSSFKMGHGVCKEVSLVDVLVC